MLAIVTGFAVCVVSSCFNKHSSSSNYSTSHFSASELTKLKRPKRHFKCFQLSTASRIYSHIRQNVRDICIYILTYASIFSHTTKCARYMHLYFRVCTNSVPIVSSRGNLLLAWINFNPTNDEQLNTLQSVGWHYISILKLQRLSIWNFGVDE